MGQCGLPCWTGVLTNREHIIALKPLEKGRGRHALALPVRGPVRGEAFRRDPGRQSHEGHARSRQAHREPESGRFEPEKFEDQYETALIDLINQKRAGKPITPKARPRRQRRRPDEGAAPERRPGRTGEGREASQEAAEGIEWPIEGKKQARETAAKNPASKPQRKSA
jgi:DNA end-binding protein Ku